MKEKFDAFSLPLDSSEITWKIQANTSTWKTIVVPYINNRAVMARLDHCFGVNGWKNEFEQWGNGAKCGISIKCNDEWITKYDGADNTKIEPAKGGLSDSMKRASTQWGLGRELYDYPTIMLEGVHKFIPDWAKEKLDLVPENRLKMNKPVYIFKND